MGHSKKRCKQCKDYAEVATGVQTPAGFFCCYDEAIEFAHNKTLKQRKQAKVQRKKVFDGNDRSKQLSLAQKAFNEFIRLRDKADSCISCGRYHDGQNHAGHYRSVGAAPHLRFNQFNVHLQCAPCNNHKSGNSIEYRIRLVKKIGVEKVEWIESQNTPKKWTLEEITAIKDCYRRMVREIKK